MCAIGGPALTIFPAFCCALSGCSSRVEEDSDYFRIELLSALVGGEIANRFFASRWQPIADYIEYTLKELAGEKRITPVNERTAALMFQGMIHEANYSKSILKAERYRDVTLSMALVAPACTPFAGGEQTGAAGINYDLSITSLRVAPCSRQ